MASGEHLKKYQFKKGQSGQTRLGKTAQENANGEIIWEGEDIAPLGNPDYVRAAKIELEEKKKSHRGEVGKNYLMPPWKPGESGNPAGRPVGSVSLVETLKKYLRRHPEEVDAIVERLVKEGKVGNLVATKEMLDRIDGRVAETHRIEGEMPIRILFVPAVEVLGTGKQEEIIEGEAVELIEEGK